MKTFMKIFETFVIFIAAVLFVICLLRGIHYANNSIPNYDKSCYYLLLAIINYLVCINLCEND